jgi:EAL and modified HD-GYP domain-containing signal transduction protein
MMERDEKSEQSSIRFIARQPILDRRQRTHGYELLFRSGPENFFDGTDPDLASSAVIEMLVLLGPSRSAPQKIFVNFTRNALVNGFAKLLPARASVIEILESVDADQAVLATCRHLRRTGYQIALDDVNSVDDLRGLSEYADIVKVDFSTSSRAQRRELARRLRPLGIKLLAEKVETREDWAEATRLGYSYFQGFYFCRPEMHTTRDIPTIKLNYLKLLTAINRRDLDLREVEEVLRQDVSLSYRLLRYLNSALFGMRWQIKSIRHALLLLGEDQIRIWGSLLAMMRVGQDKPRELLSISLVRAKFAELLSLSLSKTQDRESLFIMGLFSVVDALLDCPLEDILVQLPLTGEIKAGLRGENCLYTDIFATVLAHERAAWGRADELAARLGLDPAIISRCYLESVQWATYIMDSSTPPPINPEALVTG